MALIRHDRMLESKGERGHYFLKNYANIVQSIEKGSDTLDLEYQLDNSDIIKLQVNAHGNALFNGRSCASINEIYVDTTNSHFAEVYIKIHNSGLVTNLYKVMISSK